MTKSINLQKLEAVTSLDSEALKEAINETGAGGAGGSVTSFNTRTGDIELTKTDITDTGLNKNDIGLSNVVNIDTTNATNITSGILADNLLSNNITKMGNVFNGNNQLVKLDGTGKLPVLDGSALTNLPSAPVTSVAGKTGVVVLTKSDVGLNNVVNADTTTTTNITDSTNKRFVSDSQLLLLQNKADSSNSGYLSFTDWATFNSKEPQLVASDATKYYRGDKQWATLDKTVIGLGNVENDTRETITNYTDTGTHWLQGWSDTPATPLTINNNTTLDITSNIVALTPLAPQNSPEITYNATSNKFVYGPSTIYKPFRIICRLTGSVSSITTDRGLELQLRRGDGTTVVSVQQLLLSSNQSASFTNREIIISSFIFSGGADPFQTDGFKIFLNNNSGASFTITGINFRFERY